MCYDRGSTFWLKRFLNDGAPDPETVGISISCCNIFICILKPCDSSAGSTFVSLQTNFLYEVQSSSSEEAQKKVVHLYRSMRHILGRDQVDRGVGRRPNTTT